MIVMKDLGGGDLLLTAFYATFLDPHLRSLLKLEQISFQCSSSVIFKVDVLQFSYVAIHSVHHNPS